MDVPGTGTDGPSARDQGQESTGTVLIAGAANLAIAVAKAIGGTISGSSAMLSEAAHSVADTITEVLLLTALKRSARPADDAHPFGYGRELYLWALLASVATFVGGAVFSVTDGIHTLRNGEELGDPTVSFIVLGLAFLIEGASFLRAVRQLRNEAQAVRSTPLQVLRNTSDTTLKAVAMEDGAALIGLLLAAGGLLAGTLTGQSVWDGLAAVAIGLLLAWVAFVLGRANASLLIGRALPESVEQRISAVLLEEPYIVGVVDLVAMSQGPREVLVAAKVDFADGVAAEDIEWACEDAEQRIRARFPMVNRVFLDPTPGPGRARPRPRPGPGPGP